MELISILIPRLVSREKFFNLRGMIVTQVNVLMTRDRVNYWNDVEIVDLCDNGEMTIGEKRNELLDMANGKYLCFADDDDTVSNNYVELLLKAAESNFDCASLKGEITIDGGAPEIFEHSLKYKEWKTTNNEVKYERYPNHLNMIRADIAKQFKFPEKNHGEDHDWSKQIHESGLLKTEYYIPEIIYYYNYISNK